MVNWYKNIIQQHVEIYHSFYIINTDESTDAGEHWMCVYLNSNYNAEFFCSFANNPKYYDDGILSFIKRNSQSLICNVKRLQSNLSTVCGQCCIFFAVCKSLYVNMQQLCSVFCDNYQVNDLIVNEFVCVNFNLNLPIIDIDFLKNSLM